MSLKLNFIQAKNDSLARNIYEIISEIIELEEKEIKIACNSTPESDENVKLKLEKFEERRAHLHEILLSFLYEGNSIRFTAIQIADVQYHLKISKINTQHKKYDKIEEKFKIIQNSKKIQIEIDYEQFLTFIWQKIFKLYTQCQAILTKQLNILNDEYFLEEIKLKENILNSVEKEIIKYKKTKNKLNKIMRNLFSKCKNFEPEKIPEIISTDDNENCTGIFRRNESLLQENQSLRENLARLEQEVKDAKCKCESIQVDYDLLQAVRDKEQGETLQQRHKHDKQLRLIELECEESKEQVIELKQQAEQFQTQIEQLSDQIITVRESQQCEIEEIENRHREVIGEKDEEIAKISEQSRGLLADVIKLRGDLSVARKSVVPLDEEKEKMQQLEAESNELKRRVNSLIKILKTKSDSETKVRDQLKIRTAELDKERKEMYRLKERMESKRIDLARRERQVCQYREEINELTELIKQERQEHQYEAGLLSEVRSVMQNLMHQLQEARERADVAERRLLSEQQQGPALESSGEVLIKVPDMLVLAEVDKLKGELNQQMSFLHDVTESQMT